MKECLGVIKLKIDCMISKVRGELPNLERWKVINIITIGVHGRDVVEKFHIYKI